VLCQKGTSCFAYSSLAPKTTTFAATFVSMLLSPLGMHGAGVWVMLASR
jgi:hypothetical protein